MDATCGHCSKYCTVVSNLEVRNLYFNRVYNMSNSAVGVAVFGPWYFDYKVLCS